MMINNTKLYEKPALDMAILNNADIVTVSGGLTSKFTKITEGDSSSSSTNSVQLD